MTTFFWLGFSGGAWQVSFHLGKVAQIFKLDSENKQSSETTPSTPDSVNQTDTTVQGQDGEAYSECVDIVRAVKYCSRSLIEGTWTEEPTVRGPSSVFTPKNFESAKAFLRASVEAVHAKNLSRSLSSTPLTSKPSTTKEKVMPTCHGCHGPMGQGQHQGSAPGKQPCTLPHSLYCRGGVIEDSSWKACPPGYQFDPSIDLANGPGFEETLGTQDFYDTRRLSARMYSMPALGDDRAHYTPPTQQDRSGAVSRLVERFPGRVNVESSSPLPDEATSLLQSGGQIQGGHVDAPHQQRGTGPVAQQLQEQIQNEIESHRAANQIENQVHYRPHGVTISDLRRDTVLRSEVESVVENVISQKIPSLSAARTAVVSEPQGLPPPVPNEPQQQRGGHQVLRNSSGIMPMIGRIITTLILPVYQPQTQYLWTSSKRLAM